MSAFRGDHPGALARIDAPGRTPTMVIVAAGGLAARLARLGFAILDVSLGDIGPA